ncbi:hypothetical protein PILCRDRAFT_723150 [Piloderma croceum F 1598]|uniref:Uncharacterized protein n=1 Tax=Piloderma croceum (strain F 1598) TaxID=765440 RepID=A0A0C3EM89_PILCF|nr:hypothetical protein PILCRDRAFT_723150 [Piloderma croceum F 1598]
MAARHYTLPYFKKFAATKTTNCPMLPYLRPLDQVAIDLLWLPNRANEPKIADRGREPARNCYATGALTQVPTPESSFRRTGRSKVRPIVFSISVNSRPLTVMIPVFPNLRVTMVNE